MKPGLSTLEAVILTLLRGAQRPMYALEMTRMSEGTLPAGSAFVTLKRMVRKKLLTTRAGEMRSSEPRPKRFYDLTAKGLFLLERYEEIEPAVTAAVHSETEQENIRLQVRWMVSQFGTSGTARMLEAPRGLIVELVRDYRSETMKRRQARRMKPALVEKLAGVLGMTVAGLLAAEQTP